MYPDLIATQIHHALRGELPKGRTSAAAQASIGHAPRGLSLTSEPSGDLEKGYALRSLSPEEEEWKPGMLHPNLSWTHDRTLLKVDGPGVRAFYEIEANKNNWSAREAVLTRPVKTLPQGA